MTNKRSTIKTIVWILSSLEYQNYKKNSLLIECMAESVLMKLIEKYTSNYGIVAESINALAQIANCNKNSCLILLQNIDIQQLRKEMLYLCEQQHQMTDSTKLIIWKNLSFLIINILDNGILQQKYIKQIILLILLILEQLFKYLKINKKQKIVIDCLEKNIFALSQILDFDNNGTIHFLMSIFSTNNGNHLKRIINLILFSNSNYIRIHALNIINSICTEESLLTNDYVEQLLNCNLLDCIYKLWNSNLTLTSDEKCASIIVLANISTTTSEHRNQVLQYSLLPMVFQGLICSQINVIITSIWFINNILESQDEQSIQELVYFQQGKFILVLCTFIRLYEIIYRKFNDKTKQDYIDLFENLYNCCVNKTAIYHQLLMKYLKHYGLIQSFKQCKFLKLNTKCLYEINTTKLIDDQFNDLIPYIVFFAKICKS